MLSLQDYLSLDATAMAAGLRGGDFAAAELVQSAIQQAQRVEPEINALCTSLYEDALTQARELESAAGTAALAGIPFLIKDLADYAPHPVSRGSRLLLGHQASHHAQAVQRYVEAGLVVLGKSNTPEFGLTITTEPVASGATRNPWHAAHSAGGSSGGAAAAVAAGIVPVAHASDGGGSIRIPASCCGLFGLKPSRGLTAIEHDMADCWSGMSVGHVLSRSVRDSALFLDLVTLEQATLFPLPKHPDSFSAEFNKEPGVLRIGVQTTHPFGETIDPDCLAAVEQAARLCESLGHEVTEMEHPADYPATAKAMNKLICIHTYQALTRSLAIKQIGLDQADIETSTRQMAQAGAGITAADYIDALDTLAAQARTMAQFHDNTDIILSPVLSKIPCELGWLDMNSTDLAGYSKKFKAYSGFTALYNGTGQPSMSVPMLHTDDGLPVGALFSASWGADLRLLQLASQLEQANPWPGLAPMATAGPA